MNSLNKFRAIEKAQREDARQLVERFGCTITECPGGYRVTGPNASILISDLKYLQKSDLS
jgi:hypothetical protein